MIYSDVGGDMKIYLAGGMKSNWQDIYINKFPNFTFIDPRTHGLKDEKDYTRWDLEGVANSDVVLAYMDNSNPSGFGLCLEVGFGKALNKKIIYVCEDKNERQKYFGMVRACADFVCESIEESLFLDLFKSQI